MNEELNNLITALREELTQYGEVLALMQEQQELIINRSANDLLLNLNAVNEQMERVAATQLKSDEFFCVPLLFIKIASVSCA